jgi:hypothetical protein
MGDEQQPASRFEILSFLCMSAAFYATVVLLMAAPIVSDHPAAWFGPPAGLLLLWLGYRVATGKKAGKGGPS